MAWTLYEGDCLDIMRQMEPESVDAVVADPPYGIDYQSCRRQERTERLDKIANDKTPFVWWLYDAFRITKVGGALVCFCRWDVQDAFLHAIRWAGFALKSQVVWDRGVHGMGDLKAQFAPRHDVVWFAVKGDYSFPGDRPVSVITSQRVDAAKLLHPNEKPVALMAQIIQSISPKGATILDPFAGSGSSLLGAEAVGVNSIGIEISPDYCAIIRNRMNSRQMTLFEMGMEP